MHKPIDSMLAALNCSLESWFVGMEQTIVCGAHKHTVVCHKRRSILNEIAVCGGKAMGRRGVERKKNGCTHPRII